MKRILFALLSLAALSVGAQTNTFTPNEIILYTIPHSNLQGQTVRIVPMVTARVEVRNTNGLIVNAEQVTIQNATFRTWAERAATNKALATKQLAIYLARQVNLTNNPAASDQPIEE